jgi:hypothetical protein
MNAIPIHPPAVEMPLAFDDRERLGKGPGVHALIIAISAYTHLPKKDEEDGASTFGLRQLSSSARTGLTIGRWLIDRRERLTEPLATCRLLVAPAADESSFEPELATRSALPTWPNVCVAAEAWRADASSHRDNIAFFYFAGHGVKRQAGDHVLILQNFGDGIGGSLSGKAIDIADLLLGMAPLSTQPDIARRQMFFFDACRTSNPSIEDLQFMKTGSIWNIVKEKDVEDDRVRTTIFSAIPGGPSWANENGTFFGQALLNCLNGGAAVSLDDYGSDDAGWGISMSALPKALTYYLEKLNRTLGAGQNSEMQQVAGDVILQRLDAPPPVDVTLWLKPPTAVPFMQLSVRGYENAIEREYPVERHPVRDTLPAGSYELRGRRRDPQRAPPEYKDKVKPFDAQPPHTPCRLPVT